MTSEYLTVKEIAELKRVSRQAVDKRLRALRISGKRFGRTRVFTREEITPILEAEFRV